MLDNGKHHERRNNKQTVDFGQGRSWPVVYHGRCGEKIESTFGPLSFFFFFLSSVGDWGTGFLTGCSPPRTPGRVVSSLGEKSDSLGEVIDIADCLDLRDGAAVLVAEG